MSEDKLKQSSKVHTVYKLADGSRVPGTTTILGILNKPALVIWANKLGLQGIDSSKYTDAAARIGTLAHYLVQSDLQHTQPILDEYSHDEIDQAENSLISFYNWQKQHKIEPIFCEKLLVSEIYKYGGTIDCYAFIDGKLGLIDYKTGKAIYSEMIIQLAAYRQLLIENGNKVKNVRIIRIGRTEDEGFEEKVISALDNHFELFKHCIEVYRLQKLIS